MGKHQQLIKLFVVLLFGTAFIFSFSHYGAKAFEKITNADGEFSDGTSIGSLDISSKTKDEAKSLLEEKYVVWLKDTSIKLQYGEKSVPFDLNNFHLDSQQTIDSIKDGQKNSAFISVDKAQVEEQLEILFTQIKISDFDTKKLTESLNSTAALFESSSLTLDIYNDFLLAGDVKKDAVLNTAVIRMKEVPFSLETVVDKIPEIEISAGSTFSLLDFANKQKIDDLDSLNVIATGIYLAVLPSNFSIVERNIGNSLPNYASLGYEAKVNPSKQADLVIVNPNKAKYILNLQLENDQLKVILKGEKFIYNYQISTKDEQKIAPKTIVQYSPLLLSGKTKIQSKGVKGQIVKVYRDVYQGSELLKSEFISEDYYPPVYKVEVHGLTGGQRTTGSNTTNNNTTTDTSDQTTTTSETVQPDSSESDLWGKPNEQPK